ITDKRVSRRHAILEIVDGQLRIKPLLIRGDYFQGASSQQFLGIVREEIHTNPCFYQSSEKSQLLPLKTNLWHRLYPGDSFSLLVDKYIFRVFSTHSETEVERTLSFLNFIKKYQNAYFFEKSKNSQMLDEDSILNETPKSSSINLPDETTCAPQLERSTEIAKTQTITAKSMSFLGECRDFSKQQSNPAQRKRILPAWMLTEGLSDQNLSAPVISGGNIVIQGSEKEAICEDKTQVNITQQGKKRLISSGSSESISAEQDTGKKCKNADQEESFISSKEMPQSFSAITLSNTEVNNMKTNTQRNKIPVEELDKVSERKIITKGTPNKDEAMSCSESCPSAQSKSFHDEAQGSHSESSSDPSNPETLREKATDSVPRASEENKVKRTSCMYGANCYRKNPVHFQHFSHPGDSDYGGVQVMCQDEADDRPECPYGTSCYSQVAKWYFGVKKNKLPLLRGLTKNPQHKIEYRHSALPANVFYNHCPTLLCIIYIMQRPSQHTVFLPTEGENEMHTIQAVPMCILCATAMFPVIIFVLQKKLTKAYTKVQTLKFLTYTFAVHHRHCRLPFRRFPVRSISGEHDDTVGQPNEYDLNDSFLDDEEEEFEPTDEDSDWEPENEDQEKEDMEELLKEAKKFMKRKNYDFSIDSLQMEH
ncbi:hypothetical protein HPG69_019772, partial [Diceros bicornis minor]